LRNSRRDLSPAVTTAAEREVATPITRRSHFVHDPP
jgi:hypothetical protein